MGDNNQKPVAELLFGGFEFKKTRALWLCLPLFWGGRRFEASHHVFKPKDKAMRLEQLLEAATAREAERWSNL